MEKISFFSFKTLFTRKSTMSNVQDSILAPILYAYEDEYYIACLRYLENGEKVNICFDKYSTEIIEKSMKCSYLEALVVLHNIKDNPKDAFFIFSPDNVE